MSDWQIDEEPCPKCGGEVRWQDCMNVHCDDGFEDLYEDDPLWYDPGDTAVCKECHGTGIQRWCSACGHDLQEERERVEAC